MLFSPSQFLPSITSPMYGLALNVDFVLMFLIEIVSSARPSTEMNDPLAARKRCLCQL
jgi:hypothetical protein